MQFLQAFPIAIIDEDYEGKGAAGRGMRQLAAAIEKEGFRVVAGISYEDMYTTLPEMAMRPADAYERLVRGRLDSVDIDNLMGRTLGVMVVPYPPGIPVIMPGERITPATKAIQDYLLYAREFDRKFPGFETDIHGLRFEPSDTGRRYLVDCITQESER